MPRIKVKVNPKVLKWARESAGYSVEEIAKKLRMREEEYLQLETGKKSPTIRQLEYLSKYFMRPLAVFFLPEPPEEPTLSTSFRTLPKDKNKFSRELHIAIRRARYYQSISNELMKELGLEVTVKRANLEEDPKRRAQEERQSIGLSSEEQFNWKNKYEALNAWRDAIESKGILVFQFKFPLEDARGFCLVDRGPPVIVLNSNDDASARIFTLIHEYAHVLLGIPEIYSEELSGEEKNWCNVFASEFLIPEDDLKKDVDFLRIKDKKEVNLEKALEKMSKKFKVSKKAILTKLKTMSIISQEEYRKYLNSTKKPSDIKVKGFIPFEERCIRDIGKRFVSLLLEAKEKEIITTYDVLEYLSIKLKHLPKIERAGRT